MTNLLTLVQHEGVKTFRLHSYEGLLYNKHITKDCNAFIMLHKPLDKCSQSHMGTYYKAGKCFISFGYNVCDLRIYVLYLYGSDNSALCSNLKSWIVYHVVSASHKNNSKCCNRHENKQYTVVTASEKDQAEVKSMSQNLSYISIQ